MSTTSVSRPSKPRKVDKPVERNQAVAVSLRKQARWLYLRELARSRTAIIGALILLFFVLIAIFSPLIVPHDPYKINPAQRLQTPSAEHWMGTDELGRDLMARMGLGARFSLLVGFSATSLGLSLGTILGMIAGYVGGRVGEVIMRAMDVLLAFPGFLLAITIVAILGPGLVNVVIAVGIDTIPTFARLAYGTSLSIKENEYILAARTLGVRPIIIIGRHLFPNIVSPLIVQYTLRVATVILLAAGLGFLGLGAKSPTPEWGIMLADARSYMRTTPHVAIFPGVAIALVALSLNLFGDGLRDVLDPRLRNR
ncbi:ABC transporter permease [Chloroflexi bacterium TSY]|nr:ABC transporter permease [Chloroflexi bacterium TSY]